MMCNECYQSCEIDEEIDCKHEIGSLKLLIVSCVRNETEKRKQWKKVQ